MIKSKVIPASIILVVVAAILIGSAFFSAPLQFGGAENGTTVTQTTTITNTVITAGSATIPPSPFNNTLYLSSNIGGCIEDGYYIPCFSYYSNDSVIFNCLRSAATSSGCTVTIFNASNHNVNSTVTVWFPYTNPPTVKLDAPNGSSFINCQWTLAALIGRPYTPPYLEYCAPMNSTAFIVMSAGPGANPTPA